MNSGSLKSGEHNPGCFFLAKLPILILSNNQPFGRQGVWKAKNFENVIFSWRKSDYTDIIGF